MNFLKALRHFSSTWTGTIIIVLFFIFFIAQAFVIPSRSMVGTLYEGDMLLVKKFSYGIPTPRIPWVDLPVVPDFFNNGHLIEGKHPKRGDIVVFIPPHQQKVYFVKRNFAVGGDEVLFTSKGLYLHCFEGNEYMKEHYKGMEMLEFAGKIFVLNPYMQDHKGISYARENSTFYLMRNLARNLEKPIFGFDGENPSVGHISMQPIDLNGGEAFYKKIPQNEFFMIGDNRDNSDDSRFWGTVPYKNIIGTPWFIYLSLNLANSEEVGAQDNVKMRYTIRWDRMFKSIKTLEKGDI
ncbi:MULTISPECIES: signal peptidase I [unclassified Helicobacter]|uniref:signal peptidase I n=1 Tax=unclassified Helicobacter TaxID=2593540 RepID=UPI000CF16EF5|nr:MULTISPECIES: signal peptidase I [unclassified Helicobacter]